MNRKQRVLTIIALIAFVLIYVVHQAVDLRTDGRNATGIYLKWASLRDVCRQYQYSRRPVIVDLIEPWFMLGVIYAGLFFLLADKKEKR